MSNLKQRIFTGFALVLAIILLIKMGYGGFLMLIVMINGMGLTEFYRLNEAGEIRPMKIEGVLFSLVMLLTVSIVARNNHISYVLLLNIPAGFLLFIRQLYSLQKQPFLNLAITLAGALSITLPLCFFVGLAFISPAHRYSSGLLIGYFIILWFADSGAYLTGRLIGKHRLFARISPGKTWEGLAGGTVSAIGAALINNSFWGVLSLRQWIGMTIIIIVTGTYGDLFKSMLKRSANVKDAGHILPGHGGILDRFDSLLGSAPFAFAFLILSQ